MVYSDDTQNIMFSNIVEKKYTVYRSCGKEKHKFWHSAQSSLQNDRCILLCNAAGAVVATGRQSILTVLPSITFLFLISTDVYLPDKAFLRHREKGGTWDYPEGKMQESPWKGKYNKKINIQWQSNEQEWQYPRPNFKEIVSHPSHYISNYTNCVLNIVCPNLMASCTAQLPLCSSSAACSINVTKGNTM